MIIDINNYRAKGSDGGSNGSRQDDLKMLMIKNAISTCKALPDYQAASVILLDLMPIAAGDKEAFDAILRGKEEVRAFFEKRNTPQPSNKFEGCNFFMGQAEGTKIIGQEIDVNSNECQIENVSGNTDNYAPNCTFIENQFNNNPNNGNK